LGPEGLFATVNLSDTTGAKVLEWAKDAVGVEWEHAGFTERTEEVL
jgi:hypothetical protein